MKCNWTRRAEREYRKTVEYIVDEFGSFTALKYIDQIEYWDGRICQYPEIGSPERLLKHKKNYLYRSLIATKHSKLIYTIDKHNIVTIVDMWDMRRDPINLQTRIKSN